MYLSNWFLNNNYFSFLSLYLFLRVGLMSFFQDSQTIVNIAYSTCYNAMIHKWIKNFFQSLFFFQFVIRVCVLLRLPSASLERSWCRTSERIPAAQTTPVVRVLWYKTTSMAYGSQCNLLVLSKMAFLVVQYKYNTLQSLLLSLCSISVMSFELSHKAHKVHDRWT